VTTFLTLVCVYFSLVIFYVCYIAAVNLYYAWKTLAVWVQVFAAIPMVVFLALDAAMQLTVFTAIFLDLPSGTWKVWLWREHLVTQRLARYRSEGWPTGPRKQMATAVCEQALNPFDPTKKHC
jgi:hypothetical protein